jgi:hypothetical protein
LIKQIVKTITTFFAALGILLMITGPGFNFIPENPAILAGIVCFIISGVIKGIFWKIK